MGEIKDKIISEQKQNTRIFLSLGSNLGNRKINLSKALRFIEEKDIRIKKVSSIYKTPPWGKKDQPEFLNQVIEAETEVSPKKLLNTCKEIEKKMGRKKGERWGPRIIDIDILFYGEKIIKEENLTIPHPLITERAFVLLPLYEIAPDFIHPVRKEKIKALLMKKKGKEIKKISKYSNFQ